MPFASSFLLLKDSLNKYKQFSITDDDISTLENHCFMDFKESLGNLTKIELNIKVLFDFDKNEISFSLYDINDKKAPDYLGKLWDNIAFSNANIGEIIYLRYFLHSNSLVNPDFMEFDVINYSVSSVTPSKFNEEQFEALLPYLEQIDSSVSSDSYNNGYNNGYNSGYEEGSENNQGNSSEEYEQLLKDYAALEREKEQYRVDYEAAESERDEYKSAYSDYKNLYEGSIASRDQAIADKNQAIKDKEVAEGTAASAVAQMSGLQNKINGLEESLENSNALVNIGAGIFDGASNFLTPILNLELFGTSFTLGGLLATLLGAAVVIIVIKLFI